MAWQRAFGLLQIARARVEMVPGSFSGYRMETSHKSRHSDTLVEQEAGSFQQSGASSAVIFRCCLLTGALGLAEAWECICLSQKASQKKAREPGVVLYAYNPRAQAWYYMPIILELRRGGICL